MNKYVTLLILGVIGAGMVLVLALHAGNYPHDESAAQASYEPENAPASPETAGDQAVLNPPALVPESTLAGEEEPPLAPGGRASVTAAVESGREIRPEAPAPAVRPAPSPPPREAARPEVIQAQRPAATQAPARPIPETASVTRGKGTMLNVSLVFRGQGMALVIEADSPLPARYFLLDSPERLVVDLPGAWRNLSAPATPQNNIVKNARLGRQGDSDRLVLDLTRKLKTHSLNRLGDTKVEVVFQ